MMPSTHRERLRATSGTLSRTPSWMSAGARFTAPPPSWRIPTSKVTRVRSDGFSKIMASVLPANTGVASPARCRSVRAAARSSTSVSSAALKSSIDTRSRPRISSPSFPPCADDVFQIRAGAFLQLVVHAHGGRAQRHQPAEVHRGPDHDDIGARRLDRLPQLADLVVTVAHRRQHRTEVWIGAEDLADAAHGMRPRIDDLPRSIPPGGEGR